MPISVTGPQTLASLVTAGALFQSTSIYYTTDTLIMGDGSTITNVQLNDNCFIVKNHQWQMHANSDNSLALEIGSDTACISIRDGYSGNNWTTGGNFQDVSGNPRIKFKNVHYSYFGGTPSAFGGNAMNLIVSRG